MLFKRLCGFIPRLVWALSRPSPRNFSVLLILGLLTFAPTIAVAAAQVSIDGAITQTLKTDGNGNGQVDPGDTVEYRVTLLNTSSTALGAGADFSVKFLADTTIMENVIITDPTSGVLPFYFNATLVSNNVPTINSDFSTATLKINGTIKSSASTTSVQVTVRLEGTGTLAATNTEKQITTTIIYFPPLPQAQPAASPPPIIVSVESSLALMLALLGIVAVAARFQWRKERRCR